MSKLYESLKQNLGENESKRQRRGNLGEAVQVSQGTKLLGTALASALEQRADMADIDGDPTVATEMRKMSDALLKLIGGKGPTGGPQYASGIKALIKALEEF